MELGADIGHLEAAARSNGSAHTGGQAAGAGLAFAVVGRGACVALDLKRRVAFRLDTTVDHWMLAVT